MMLIFLGVKFSWLGPRKKTSY